MPEFQDIAPDAVIIEGVARNGKPCRIVDNTASVSREELQQLLDTLIREKQFGIQGQSSAGGETIRIGGPRFTHIQIGDGLYRLLLLPYEARLEKF